MYEFLSYCTQKYSPVVPVVLSGDHKGEGNAVVWCSAGPKRHTCAVHAKRGTLGAGQRHTSGVQAQRGGQRQPRAPGHQVLPSKSSSPWPLPLLPSSEPVQGVYLAERLSCAMSAQKADPRDILYLHYLVRPIPLSQQ